MGKTITVKATNMSASEIVVNETRDNSAVTSRNGSPG